MAVRRSGRGPDVVLFHGGMGSWKHWTRNIEPLAARFTVHALDHPSYGASAVLVSTHGGRVLAGEPARLVEEIAELADCGVEHLVLEFLAGDGRELDEQMAAFAERVRPKLA